MTRLLTDAELALPPDSLAPPPENEQWTTRIGAIAKPIRSLGSNDFSDLRFFAPLLDGKRIVQLGESGHGVAEFNMAKVRLIRYLHEELGYDVIAFESSVFECNRAQRAIATLSADDLMRNCIFGVWHTAEVTPLFEYIKQTQSTARPLILAGFDEQTSSGSASARPAFFFDVISKLDTAYARDVARRDSANLAAFRSQDRTSVARDRDAIVAFYDSVATWLRSHEVKLASLMPDDTKAPIIARQTAVSMTYFARQIAAGPSGAGTSIRDLGMANNLDFLLDEMFPEKKVMVWAHNFHIQHRQNVPTSDVGSGVKPKTMGVWVAERHRRELYTIGLFMYRGGAAMNNRQPYAVRAMPAGSLESILHRVPWKYSYVDLSKATNTAVTSWMFQRIITMEWGTNIDPLIPRDEYDGILFIDTAHPPQYRVWGSPPRAQ
jgi:erythromycin esterase